MLLNQIYTTKSDSDLRPIQMELNKSESNINQTIKNNFVPFKQDDISLSENDIMLKNTFWRYRILNKLLTH